MKFLCLCYYDPRKLEALSAFEMRALERECEPRDDELYRTGRVLAAGSLMPPERSAVLLAGADGPRAGAGAYAPANEPIGGFFVVDAPDLDEALRVAAKHSGAHAGRYLGGGIEVRACDSFEQPRQW